MPYIKKKEKVLTTDDRVSCQYCPAKLAFWVKLNYISLPVGVLLRNEEEGVMGGVTGGVRLPLLWRGGVDTFPRDTELDKVKESLG